MPSRSRRAAARTGRVRTPRVPPGAATRTGIGAWRRARWCELPATLVARVSGGAGAGARPFECKSRVSGPILSRLQVLPQGHAFVNAASIAGSSSSRTFFWRPCFWQTDRTSGANATADAGRAPFGPAGFRRAPRCLAPESPPALARTPLGSAGGSQQELARLPGPQPAASAARPRDGVVGTGPGPTAQRAAHLDFVLSLFSVDGTTNLHASALRPPCRAHTAARHLYGSELYSCIICVMSWCRRRGASAVIVVARGCGRGGGGGPRARPAGPRACVALGRRRSYRLR